MGTGGKIHSKHHDHFLNHQDNNGVETIPDWVLDHIAKRIGNPKLATQNSIHPIVLTHPRTGQKGLYVNPQFTTHIEGWTTEESEPFLAMLYQHTMQQEYQCRFRWAKGSVAIWDNLATWHQAINDYHGFRRLMHRITIEGVKLQ